MISISLFAFSIILLPLLDRIRFLDHFLFKGSTYFLIMASSFMLGFVVINRMSRFRIYERGLIASAYRPKDDPETVPRGRFLGKRVIPYDGIRSIHPAATSAGSGNYLDDVGVIIILPREKEQCTCSYLSFRGNQLERLIEATTILKGAMGGSWRSKYRPGTAFFEKIEVSHDPEIQSVVSFFMREWDEQRDW